jgi:hypothetical protein
LNVKLAVHIVTTGRERVRKCDTYDLQEHSVPAECSTRACRARTFQ